VDRRSWILLTISALFVALAFQGTRGLYDPSEGRYAEVAREMRATGNYLEPTLAHHPHWTKPPLTYWSIAVGLAVVGNNTWGVRASNALAFVITTLAVAATAATLWGSQTGFFAGLIYLSSLFPVVGASVATADTLLAMWTALALLAYVRAWRGTRSAVWTRVMWLMFGMAFFTKGPPALLPLVALIVFHIAARRPFRLFDIAGLLLFVVSSFWWYGLMVSRHHELLSYFVEKEIVARNTSGVFHRNAHWYGPFVVYAPVLLLGSGLWTIDAVRGALSRGLGTPRGLWRALSMRASAGALLLMWVLLPLTVFVFSRSRLPLYLLPLYGAAAIAIARTIGGNTSVIAFRRRVVQRTLLSVCLLVVLKAAVSFVPSRQDATRLYREAEQKAGPDAQLALYAESSQYGLQFYTGDDLIRLSRSGTEWWADGTVRESLVARDESRPFAILTHTGHADELATALRASREPFARASVAGQEMFVVGAPVTAVR
jgi:4-amino-4-deoxy-L-arabinose transferase